METSTVNAVEATLQEIGDLARGTWPACALDELRRAAEKIHAAVPGTLAEMKAREEWRVEYGRDLSEAEWREVLGEWLDQGYTLCGFRSLQLREAQPTWYHEAFLRVPETGRKVRFARAVLSERTWRVPEVLTGFTMREIKEDMALLFSEGTLLPAFSAAAGGAR